MPPTKDDIALEFRKLVLRYGYSRAAVEDVARALHISKKTIYDLHGNKEGLYRNAVELWAKEQRARVESLLTEASAIGRIVQVISIAFADARQGFAAITHHDDTEPPEILNEVNARVFGPMIRDLIEAGNASGEFAVKDPGMTAAFGVAIGTEAVRMLREDPSGKPEEAAIEAFRRLIVGQA